jgi:exosortase
MEQHKRRWLNAAQRHLELAWKTKHGRICMIAGFALLCYLPAWCHIAWQGVSWGSAALLLNIGFCYLGIEPLWQARSYLAQVKVFDEERLLGYLFIFGCLGLLPFYGSSENSAVAIAIGLLIGIGYSTWGNRLVFRYPRSLFILLAVHPNPLAIALMFRDALMPRRWMETSMAQAGSAALRMVGQPAISREYYIQLPSGGVEVWSGCSGFDPAVTLMMLGLIVGLVMRQNRWRTVSLMVAGLLMPLIMNVPRLMLLTMASVYWGTNAFDFWHVGLGAQMFSATLFTIYYYLAMAIVKLPESPS